MRGFLWMGMLPVRFKTQPNTGAFQRLAFAMNAAGAMECQMTLMSKKLWWLATMTKPLSFGIFSAPSTETLIPNNLKMMFRNENVQIWVQSSQ